LGGEVPELLAGHVDHPPQPYALRLDRIEEPSPLKWPAEAITLAAFEVGAGQRTRDRISNEESESVDDRKTFWVGSATNRSAN
jgi:hypothetical protein